MLGFYAEIKPLIKSWSRDSGYRKNDSDIKKEKSLWIMHCLQKNKYKVMKNIQM